MSQLSFYSDPKYIAKRLRRVATSISDTDCPNPGLLLCYMLHVFLFDAEGEEKLRRIAAFSGVITDEKATNALRQALQLGEEIEDRGAQPLELMISRILTEWAEDFKTTKYSSPLNALASKLNRFVNAFDTESVVDFFEEMNETNPQEDKLIVSRQETTIPPAEVQRLESERLERKEKRRKARTLTTAV